MKAVLFTGMLVLLLLAAPAQTYALGLAEYGQEVAADQPVLPLPRLNSLAEYFRGWQPGRAAHSFREMVPVLFRVSQLLLTAALLTGCRLGRRRGFRKYLVKARRAVQHLRSGVHAGAC